MWCTEWWKTLNWFQSDQKACTVNINKLLILPRTKIRRDSLEQTKWEFPIKRCHWIVFLYREYLNNSMLVAERGWKISVRSAVSNRRFAVREMLLRLHGFCLSIEEWCVFDFVTEKVIFLYLSMYVVVVLRLKFLCMLF